MKVVILGNNSSANQSGLLIYLEALAQGRDVHFVHYNNRPQVEIGQELAEIKPDWVFITGMRSVQEEYFDIICDTYKVMIWDADALNGQREKFWRLRGPKATICINSTLAVAEKFRDEFRVEWVPQFYDQHFFKPTLDRLDPSQPIYDVCFLGDSDSDRYRQDVLRQLKLERFNCCFRGSHAKIDQGREYAFGTEMADIYRQSKIAIDIRRQSGGFSYGACTTSDRMYKAMGCGAMYLTFEIPQIEKLFVPNKELVMYPNYKDMVHKILYYLTVEDERERIAAAGAAAINRSHTLVIRIGEYWELMEKG